MVEGSNKKKKLSTETEGKKKKQEISKQEMASTSGFETNYCGWAREEAPSGCDC